MAMRQFTLRLTDGQYAFLERKKKELGRLVGVPKDIVSNSTVLQGLIQFWMVVDPVTKPGRSAHKEDGRKTTDSEEVRTPGQQERSAEPTAAELEEM